METRTQSDVTTSREFEGRKALVTGAAQGLGRAIAELFVQRGAQVMIADIDAAGAADVASSLGPAARSVACDMTRDADVARAVETTLTSFDGLDLLVNNAGIEVVKPLFEQTEEEFSRLMDVNVLGVFLGMKHAVPALRASGRGAIVNMSSVAGIGGAPLFGSYCASKAAVIQLTRVAALELRDAGIRVNAVCPAFIGTAMVERLTAAIESASGVAFGDIVALKQQRLGTAQEVAEMVAFLASDQAAWVTGAHYILDGGNSASLL